MEIVAGAVAGEKKIDCTGGRKKGKEEQSREVTGDRPKQKRGGITTN